MQRQKKSDPSRLGLLESRFFASMRDDVNRGNQKHDYNYGDPQTTDNGPRQWRVLLASSLNAQRHRKQTEKRRERGHENRPQSHFAGFHNRFLELHTTLM